MNYGEYVFQSGRLGADVVAEASPIEVPAEEKSPTRRIRQCEEGKIGADLVKSSIREGIA